MELGLEEGVRRPDRVRQHPLCRRFCRYYHQLDGRQNALLSHYVLVYCGLATMAQYAVWLVRMARRGTVSSMLCCVHSFVRVAFMIGVYNIFTVLYIMNILLCL
jgi:hypothetical protein